MPSTARDAYLLRRGAPHLSPIVTGQQNVAKAGGFRPRAVEKKFGFANTPDGLPPLEIHTPLGRRALLRGLIDRVDLAEVGDELLGIVVDYKRTRDKRLDLTNVYHGLALQLLGYLLALADRGESLAGRPIIPAGAFYVSLLRKYHPVDHPDDAEEAKAEAMPRGLLDGGRIDALDAKAPEVGRSSVLSLYRKKDGSLGHVDSTDAAEPEAFDALLAHTRQKMGELADGVIDGDISVSPYRLRTFSPCQWCDMRTICRFEFGDPGMRHLEALKRSGVFEKLEDDA
jgi:ATP-dependent helicase/nuclease subunit B